jgi:RNA polymerase sigma-70 factor (ECF subfamily)
MSELRVIATPESPSTPLDDAELVRRVVAGDHAAFDQLMRRHNRLLYRLARATLRDDTEAEDALQEAYLLAYRKMSQYRGDAALATWLSRLVLNECLGRLRRQTRRGNVLPMVPMPDDVEESVMDNTSAAPRPDEALMRSEMRSLIERKLDELPDTFRTVFVLRCVEELSVEEAAACLEVPEATVRSRLFRARSMLRESLAREMDLAERDLFEFAGKRCDRIVATVLERLSQG